MEESKRQRQVARLIQEEMSTIFLREGLNMIGGGMVSISKVNVTPDLLEARVYLSFFQVPNVQEALQQVKESTKEIRKQLGLQIKNQVRRIPELTFFNDDTLDHVFKMEALFQKIREEKENQQKPDA